MISRLHKVCLFGAAGICLFLISTTAGAAAEKAAGPAPIDAQLAAPAVGTETPARKDVVTDAAALIHEKNYTEAEKLLNNFITTYPDNWRPFEESETAIEGYFWSKEEFIAFCDHVAKPGEKFKKAVHWIPLPSYSEAYYYLAWIAVEQKNYKAAAAALDQALALEPNHPLLYIEKAYAMQKMGKVKEAHDLFLKASKVRPWAPKQTVARALRGAGYASMDLKKWSVAAGELEEALAIESDNEMARTKLLIAQKMLAKEKPADKSRGKK
jgi:tetratricopeptide (TPR) repeat protein